MADTKIISVEVRNDNTQEVIQAMKKQVMDALLAIGSTAEGYAKDDCPVGTPESTGKAGYIGGRLRNSITYATKEYHSKGNDRGGASTQTGDTKLGGTPEDQTVYLGTNVEYAPYVELGSQKHLTGKNHFIRDALAKHGNEYKEILRASLDR